MPVFPFAVLAWPWKKANIGIRKWLAVVQLVHPQPGDAEQFVGFVFAERQVVFGHTGYHAGTASSALIEINDHSESMGFFLIHLYLIAGLC
jgi:hypothetical protein